MRFEKVYGGWQPRRLSQEEAAEILEICSRAFRRQICHFEEEGLAGLNDELLIPNNLKGTRSSATFVGPSAGSGQA
jgi:hypothetical protein